MRAWVGPQLQNFRRITFNHTGYTLDTRPLPRTNAHMDHNITKNIDVALSHMTGTMHVHCLDHGCDLGDLYHIGRSVQRTPRHEIQSMIDDMGDCPYCVSEYKKRMRLPALKKELIRRGQTLKRKTINRFDAPDVPDLKNRRRLASMERQFTVSKLNRSREYNRMCLERNMNKGFSNG